MGGLSIKDAFPARSEDAELLMFLFSEFLGVGFLGSGGFNGLGLVGTLAGIDVAVRVFDVRVFAQLGEVGAEGGLQFLVIERILNFGKDILQRRNAGLLVIHDFQGHVSLFGVNHACDIAGLLVEGFVFDGLCQLSALEHAKCAPVGGGGAVRIFLRNVLEIGAIVNLLEEIVCLGFGGGESCGIGSLFRGFIDGRLGGRG